MIKSNLLVVQYVLFRAWLSAVFWIYVEVFVTMSERDLGIWLLDICRLFAMQWYVEEEVIIHSKDYRKQMKISHRDTLQTMKSLFEWRMSTILSLQSDKNVTEGQTLEHWTKLMNRLKGIGLGYEKVIGSRTVLMLANGMWHRLKEELKNDGALLSRLLFLAYLDIGGEHISSVFPCIYLFSFFVFFL